MLPDAILQTVSTTVGNFIPHRISSTLLVTSHVRQSSKTAQHTDDVLISESTRKYYYRRKEGIGFTLS
jgi:hypothetical protein